MRSARVRTLLLWELGEFRERLDPSGRPFDAAELLAGADTKAYQHIVTSKVAGTQGPANRVMLPTVPGVSVRRALLTLAPDLAGAVLASHGIPREALDFLRADDDAGFIATRARYLAERERIFIAESGVRAADTSIGEADIDTE